MPTLQQIEHREYLKSSTWKSIRLKALQFYGCKCSKCGCYGTDVHHITYDRVGGNERIDDLTVLCRECHEATHALLRSLKANGKAPRHKSINVRAAIGYLSLRQKNNLKDKYPDYSIDCLIFEMTPVADSFRRDLMEALQVDEIIGIPSNQSRFSSRVSKNSKGVINRLIDLRIRKTRKHHGGTIKTRA